MTSGSWEIAAIKCVLSTKLRLTMIAGIMPFMRCTRKLWQASGLWRRLTSPRIHVTGKRSQVWNPALAFKNAPSAWKNR